MLVFARHDGCCSLRSRPDAACITQQNTPVYEQNVWHAILTFYRSETKNLKKTKAENAQLVRLPIYYAWRVMDWSGSQSKASRRAGLTHSAHCDNNTDGLNEQSNKTEKLMISMMTYQWLHFSLHLRLLHGTRHLESIYFFHHFGDAPSTPVPEKVTDGCCAFRRVNAEMVISDFG